jgi:peroxiredoxin
MRRIVFLAGLICFVMGIAAQVPYAQETKTTEKPKIVAAAKDAKEPKAEDVLRKMADYLAKLDAVSCQLNMEMRIEARGMKNEMTTKTAVRIARPNRYAMVVEEGVMGMTTINDGQEITTFIPSLNRFTVKEVSENDEEAEPMAVMAGSFGKMGDFVKAKNGEELLKVIMEGVKESKYVGSEDVDGVPCDRVQLIQDEFTFDLWIEKGAKPLPRKFVPDMSKQLAELGERGQDMKLEFNVTLTNWDTAPKFADADFAFIPPAGAEQVDSMFEGLQNGGQEEGPHPLLGQPAPKFATVNPSGEPIDLEKLLRKNIIMLDFWATWCGPCVAAMPKVDEVAKKFADRGVVFYAVNLGDDVDTVKQFLVDQKLDVPVAMDTEGKLGSLYHAEAIPMTVLIGKDGKVQVVHVGFSENLAEELSSELESLLAGKDLAAEALAKTEKKTDEKAEEPATKTTEEAK